LVGNGGNDFSPRFADGGVPGLPDGRWVLSLDAGTTIQLTFNDGQLGDSLWLHRNGKVTNTRPLRWIMTIDRGQLLGHLRTTQASWQYTVRGRVAVDGTVNGTWEFCRHYDSADPDNTGALQAELVPWAAAASAETPITGEGWPAYGGLSGSFISQPQGHTLLKDIRTMRPVWRSEAVLPSGIGSISRTAKGRGIRKAPLAGGSSSPILVDGKIYVMTFHPGQAESSRLQDYEKPFYDDGQSIFQRYHALWGPRFGAKAEAFERRRWSIDASDALYCIDAATGATMWVSAIPGAANAQDHKGGYNNFTPCYHDGAIIAQGSTRRLFSFDAETGALRWKTAPNSGLEGALQSSLASGDPGKPFFATSRWGFEAPIIVDEQIIIARGGLECRDPATGDRLWRFGDVVDRVPAVWRHAGQSYLIAWNGARTKMHCIDMQGQAVWSTADLLQGNLSSHLIGIDGDTFALLEGTQNTEETVLVIGRLTLTGPEVLHRITRSGANSNFMPPVIRDGTVAAAWNDGVLLADVKTGSVLAESDAMSTSLNGHIQTMEEYFLVLGDNHHGINDYHWTDGALTQAPRVSPPMFTTSPYTSAPYNQVYADGRLFIRGSDGVYAFDLRDPVATAGNASPNVQFSMSATAGATPFDLSVDASASIDPDGDPLAITWDFGDGVAVAGAQATHRFATPGRYRIRCTATDSKGIAAHQWAWVRVVDGSVNNAPIIKATVSPMSGTIPLQVTLDATGTTDLEGDDLTYTWIMPDGTTADGINAQATITVSGRAAITLRAEDSRGAVTERNVAVLAQPPSIGTVIWHEAFADVADAAKEDTGDTAWTSTGVGRVVSGAFEARDADAGSVWTSAAIDTSALAQPAIELVLKTPNSTQLEQSDFAEIAYQADGGEMITTHRFNGPIAGGADHSVVILTPPAEKLTIRVTLQNSSGSEVHQIKNVRVFDAKVP
jgi:outer membrane protein assembly factor BamB